MASSPTGRTPKLLWTPAYQDILNRMVADYKANTLAPATLGGRLFKYAKQIADAGTSYSDFGLYATFIYQATGDPAYAAKALTAVNRTDSYLAFGCNAGWFSRPAVATDCGMGRNWGRAFLGDLVLMYDWLWPYLESSRNRATWLGQLNAAMTVMNTDGIQLRPTDTDQ